MTNVNNQNVEYQKMGNQFVKINVNPGMMFKIPDGLNNLMANKGHPQGQMVLTNPK